MDNPNEFVIEKYDIQKDLWTKHDILEKNRVKFGAISLTNGNILILGGKQVIIK